MVSAAVFLTCGVFADLTLFCVLGLVRLVFCLSFRHRTIANWNNGKEFKPGSFSLERHLLL